MIYHVNINQKKVGVAIIVIDKILEQGILLGWGETFHKNKVVITILNNHAELQCTWIKTNEVEKRNNSTFIVGDFNIFQQLVENNGTAEYHIYSFQGYFSSTHGKFSKNRSCIGEQPKSQ